MGRVEDKIPEPRTISEKNKKIWIRVQGMFRMFDFENINWMMF